MQLFFTINGWAGQNAFLDVFTRAFYVAAIPLLATILVALIIFRPTRFVADDTRVRRIALAAISAIALCALLPVVVNWFSQAVLGTPILSSRPFVTHWVNALVVEPNDNAFPCGESAMIGALWLAIWATSPKLAWPFLLYSLLFCLARVFCGANFVEDVLVGWLCGVALAFCALSLCRVRLRREKRFPWYRVLENVFPRLKYQAMGAFFLLISSVVAFWFFGLHLSPSHYDGKIGAFWNERRDALLSGTLRRNDVEYSKRGENGKNANTDVLREGEGAPIASNESLIASDNKEIPRPETTSLGGNLPMQAAQLKTALQSARLAHPLVSVQVASLRGDAHSDNTDEEHFASVRFQVQSADSDERKRVAQTARKIVEIAFAHNTKLQNIDVVGVVLSDATRDGVKYAVFGDGVIPVFSASVERQKLVLGGTKAIFDAPTANNGLWLRARSRLWFNERVLPEKPLGAVTNLFQNQTPQNNAPLVVFPKVITPKVVVPQSVPRQIIPKNVVPKTIAPTPKTLLPQGVLPKTTPKIVIPKPLFYKPKPKAAPRGYGRQSSTRFRVSKRPRRVYRQRAYRKYRRHRRE